MITQQTSLQLSCEWRFYVMCDILQIAFQIIKVLFEHSSCDNVCMTCLRLTQAEQKKHIFL